MGPTGPHLSQLTFLLDPKTLLLIKHTASADISREFSGDQEQATALGWKTPGDHGGHVTEQDKSQTRIRSVEGLPARSSCDEQQRQAGSRTRTRPQGSR